MHDDKQSISNRWRLNEIKLEDIMRIIIAYEKESVAEGDQREMEDLKNNYL